VVGHEREPGKFLWHDAVVDGVRQGGLNILGLPDHPPKWAEVKTEGANPVNVAAFGKYCEELARHYAGKIDYWEVWNEPYMPGSFSGGAKLFGELLQAGAGGFKRGNPNCKVLGWCADVATPSGARASPPRRGRASTSSPSTTTSTTSPAAARCRSSPSWPTTASSGRRT